MIKSRNRGEYYATNGRDLFHELDMAEMQGRFPDRQDNPTPLFEVNIS